MSSFIQTQKLAIKKKSKKLAEAFVLFKLPYELIFIILNYTTSSIVNLFLNKNTQKLVIQYCEKVIKNTIYPKDKYVKFYVALQQLVRSAEGEKIIDNNHIYFSSTQGYCGGCGYPVIYQQDNCDLIYYSTYNYDNITCYHCGTKKSCMTKEVYHCGCMEEKPESFIYKCTFGCEQYSCHYSNCPNYKKVCYGDVRLIWFPCDCCGHGMNRI